MAWVKYESNIYSLNTNSTTEDQSRWRIQILEKTYNSGDYKRAFRTTSDGFTLKMDGNDDDLLAPIKTSTVSFNYIINDDTGVDQIIDDLNQAAANNEENYCVRIQKYCVETSQFRDWWFGVLLADLAVLADTSPNRIIKIEATDGFSQLKYKTLNTGTDGFSGDRSALNIIKICLNQITYVGDSDFDFFDESLTTSKANMIAHIPQYYNKAMGALDPTWRENVNHDPLALVKFNISIFQDENGKPWSYYKILEQVLSAFQLRIMMTPVWDDQITPTASNKTGRPMFFLQAPLNYHDNDNDSNYQSYQLIFYHNKNLISDVALSYTNNFISDTVNPTQKISGSKEMFMPPLLSYKTFYDHNLFNAVAAGPYSFSAATYQNTTLTGYEFSTGTTWGGLQMDLTGRENIGSVGYTDPANEVAKQRVLITGKVSVFPIDLLYYQTSGISGYLSGKNYWEQYNEEYLYSGSGFFIAQDNDSVIMPRMGLRVNTISEYVGGPGGVVQDNFWLYDTRFAYLFGGCSWQRDVVSTTGYQTNQYPDSFYGIGNGYQGFQYNPATSTYITAWGTDTGVSNYGWWRAPVPAPTYYKSGDNHWAYFTPYFHEISLWVGNNGSTWNDDYWGSMVSAEMDGVSMDIPFAILSPQIPWGRGEGQDYGWSRISQVELYAALKRDTVWSTDDGNISGQYHYAACKDWLHNRELLCKDRGIHWSYNYSDLRCYVVGVAAGQDSFDASYGFFINENGTPTEEYVQDPPIIIGDEPQFNPYADIEELDGFGGDYVGQFKIFTTANEDASAQEGPDTQMWRTKEQGTSSSEDNKLHIKRAKQALAHRVQIKKKLELNLMDRTDNRDLERKCFSNILFWNSGEWYQNQSGANIAFMVSGGTFTAGTGKLKLTVMDCVSYSKNNLVDNSFSSEG